MAADDRETNKTGSGSNVGNGGDDDGNKNGSIGSSEDIGNDDGNIDQINTETIGSGGGSGQRKNAGQTRRGRPSGSGKTESNAKTATVVLKKNESILATQLVGIHKMIGMVTGYGQIMEIDEGQADQLAAGLMAVMDQYKIKVNPKMLASGQLIATMAAIYAPKLIVIAALNKQRREQSRQNTQPENAQAGGGSGVIIG